MNYALNDEKRRNNASSNFDDIVNRNMILQWLKEDISFLRKMARCKNPIKNPIRVKLLRASIYGCSVLLSGLKDEELELRIVELEEKLKNGLLIPIEKRK
ncbi:hypothetical protein ACFLRN_02795 [Thermoproteota archaeon]